MEGSKEMFFNQRELSYQDVDEYYEWTYRPQVVVTPQVKVLTQEQKDYKNYVQRRQIELTPIWRRNEILEEIRLKEKRY